MSRILYGVISSDRIFLQESGGNGFKSRASERERERERKREKEGERMRQKEKDRETKRNGEHVGQINMVDAHVPKRRRVGGLVIFGGDDFSKSNVTKRSYYKFHSSTHTPSSSSSLFPTPLSPSAPAAFSLAPVPRYIA
ncbi:hypothetical protein ACS0PU_000269 [Formica fusca]